MDRTSARAQLEEALFSAELCSEDRVRLLVDKAFSCPPSDGDSATPDEHVLKSRSAEVWKFLEDLRGVGLELAKESAVVDDIDGRGWKVKEDTGNMRVLYRKGPEGTPLHTLCLEGMIKGPLATALCVAWEAPYFKDWWPQFTVPTFKISESKWIEQAQPGQVIASVRFKVPWPFTAREIVLEAYAIDYLVKDVLIVLIKTLEPGPSPLTRDGPSIPPEEKGVTRMEVVGGYIFQQIAPSQCYFRTIADIDLKLALVPAWVINFISRQLAGLGLKLFEKVVQDVTAAKNTKFVKVFQRLLETDPFLQQVKKGLAAPKPLPVAEDSQKEKGAAEIVATSERIVVSYKVLATETPLGEDARGEMLGSIRSRQVAASERLARAEDRESSSAVWVDPETSEERWQGSSDERTRGQEKQGALTSDRVSVAALMDKSRHMRTQELATLARESVGYRQEASTSTSGRDQGVSGVGPSGIGAAGTSAEAQRCVEVLDRAIGFFWGRKGGEARSDLSEGGRLGSGAWTEGHRILDVEARSRSRREGDGKNLAKNGHSKPLSEDKMHGARGTLDRAIMLMRELAS